MAKKVLSIAIGAEITKVCELSYRKNYKNKGIHVYKSISFPTQENTIEDGFIKDKSAFSDQLRSQLRAAKIKSKKAIFSIASSKIANREVIIPLVKEDRIMGILKTGASDYFPIDIKDYILSYIILEKKSSDRKEKADEKKRKKQEAKLAKRQTVTDKKSKGKGENAHSDRVKNSSSTKLMFSEEGPKTENKSSEKVQKQKNKTKMSKNIRLAVYAVPASIVKNYYNFAQIAGLDVVSIDYSGNSSYQMLNRQAKMGTNVFVQLNERDTVVSILKDNILILQRTIGYGISSLIETVMEQTYFNVNNEAEAMELLQVSNLLELLSNKQTTSESPWSSTEEAAVTSELTPLTPTPAYSAEENQARRSIVESLSFLSNSISRMLDYYKNNNSNVSFESIHLTGIGIRIQGIERYFSQEIGINNTKIEKLSTVSSKKRAKAYLQNPSEFMACVGAVIKPVNFVPLELIERRERRTNITVSTILILVSIGSSAVLSYFAYQDYSIAEQKYQQSLVQYESMPSTEATMEEYNKAVERLEDLHGMEAAMQGDQRISEVLTELQTKLLSNASVQSIEFRETGVVMQIIMADNTYGTNTLLAKLLSQIKTIELFDEVLDSNLTVSEYGQISVTISCTYAQ